MINTENIDEHYCSYNKILWRVNMISLEHENKMFDEMTNESKYNKISQSDIQSCVLFI